MNHPGIAKEQKGNEVCFLNGCPCYAGPWRKLGERAKKKSTDYEERDSHVFYESRCEKKKSQRRKGARDGSIKGSWQKSRTRSFDPDLRQEGFIVGNSR